MSRRLILLFGAGASAHSEPPGVKVPPVGDDLFAQLKATGNVPADLPAEVLDEFVKEGGFETAMSKLAILESTKYTPFLRGMAKFFAPFLPSPKSYYIELFSALKGTQDRLFVATLNYENLIEHAFLKIGMDPLRVLKPHGSCGALPDFGTNKVTGLVAGPNTRTLVESPTRREFDPAKIISWCDDPNNSSLAPSMSFFAPGKATAVNRQQIEILRDEWKNGVQSVEACFVVGVRCNPDDDHIWGPLADSRCRLVYVNPSDAGFARWQRDHKRPDAEHRPIGFGDVIPEIVAAATRF